MIGMHLILSKAPHLKNSVTKTAARAVGGLPLSLFTTINRRASRALCLTRNEGRLESKCFGRRGDNNSYTVAVHTRENQKPLLKNFATTDCKTKCGIKSINTHSLSPTC